MTPLSREISLNLTASTEVEMLSFVRCKFKTQMRISTLLTSPISINLILYIKISSSVWLYEDQPIFSRKSGTIMGKWVICSSGADAHFFLMCSMMQFIRCVKIDTSLSGIHLTAVLRSLFWNLMNYR